MRTILALLWWLVAAAALAGIDDEFPHRAFYPDVPVMETEQLYQSLTAVNIVDVRSRFEYETLHINAATNIPLTASDSFEAALRSLQELRPAPLVFYCNGKTCKKSYEAARRALFAKLTRVYAYDAGITTWAKVHPEYTTLLGVTPIQAGDLIEPKDFEARLLDPKDFAARVKADTYQVLDIRDAVQRDSPLFPFREERAGLDQRQKLDAILTKAKTENKTLLVYDKTGHQVQWFQYYLVRRGVGRYYFMRGGSEGYFEATFGKVILGASAANTRDN